MHALIVWETKSTDLSDYGYETFGEGDVIYAVGDKSELEELISTWVAKKVGSDTIYKTDKGFYVGLSHRPIVKIGGDD